MNYMVTLFKIYILITILKSTIPFRISLEVVDRVMSQSATSASIRIQVDRRKEGRERRNLIMNVMNLGKSNHFLGEEIF